MRYKTSVFINKREISINNPVYFVADIASNHDGDLERAKNLIWLAKEAKADAVKFQHFKAEKLVSDYGFKKMNSQVSHQKKWKKSVFEIYKQYECKRNWTEELIKTAKEANIDFFTAPYDFEALEIFESNIPAYKIGSGDITRIDFIEKIAQKGKTVILSTGASTIKDVQRAVEAILRFNKEVAILQCNTNYTGNIENMEYINLNVLKSYSTMYPGMILGLSDHTKGYATVLGAVTLGARIIEKHFTDDNDREGPDHSFALTPIDWKDMIERSKELEAALGDGIKKVEENEKETVIVQRRCLRVNRKIEKGEKITEDMLEELRPSPKNSIQPYEIKKILGRKLNKEKENGEALYFTDFYDEF